MQVLSSVLDALLSKVAIPLSKEIISMKEQLTGVFEKVPEARANLQEAVQLVLESSRALVQETLRNKTVIREPLASIS